MKDVVLNYFDELNYSVIEQTQSLYHLKQNRTGLEVEIDFSVLGQGTLPTDTAVNKHKKLFFLYVSDVETIGFEALEVFASDLNEHCSLAILEQDYFEHTMKEIWMFLANDPRDRNVFTESRFYSAQPVSIG